MQQISINQLTADMILAEDIHSPNGSVTLRGGTVMTDTWVKRITQWGVKNIKVKPEKEAAGFDDSELDRMLQSVLEPGRFQKENTALKVKEDIAFLKVYNGLESQLSGIFVRTRCNSKVDIRGMQELSKKIADSILSIQDVVLFIQMPTRGEKYLYRHALDVAVYAGLLGRWLQYSKEEVAMLVYAGLIHDIGKANVLFEIISKPDALSHKEQIIAKKHVAYGVNILTQTAVVPQEILLAVEQHHERMDGAGYPNGLEGHEISAFAKILTIVDVYDALTSNRYYKKAVSPMRAGEIMLDEMKGAFDLNYLNLFLTNVFESLLGKSANLSNGMEGKIISFSNFPELKPVVELVCGQQIDLAQAVDIDLVKINFAECI